MAWSNLGPTSEQQPWHYRHAAKWLRAHPEAAGPEVKLNHRTLYQEARENQDYIERGSGPGEAWAMFPVWLVVSLLKRNLWLARQDVAKNKCCSSIRGIVGKVRADMKGRMERDILKWGQRAALERWKEGLGLVG
ncbi:hypothetical protein KUCAC02_026970 [Chaenocephalus aceratus]|nr:hypothetical protein KUCAC02_026970 [Chaenocephalus aceratus]